MGSLDATKTTKASDVSGNNPPSPGTYLTVIKDVKWNEKSDHEIVELQVLGGTTPDQSGREIAAFLLRDDDGEFTDRHLRFALASEILKPGQKAENVDFNFFSQAKDRFLVVRFEEYTKKDKTKGSGIAGFGLDMWSPLDPEVIDIVRKMDGKAALVLQRLTGGGAGGANGGANGNQQQAAQSQTAPAQNAPAMAAAGSNAQAPSDEWDMV